MKYEMKCVAAFHEKMGISPPVDLAKWEPSPEAVKILEKTVKQSEKLAKELLDVQDDACIRVHLIVEEGVHELAKALLEKDRVLVLDALSDLLYVLAGAAVVFDMPLEDGFNEVHNSNMTKMKMPSDPDARRLRDKGPNYKPADLKRVLDMHDKRKALRS
jgi:predicted HAD superfamily Cof-like phosphohydrolase